MTILGLKTARFIASRQQQNLGFLSREYTREPAGDVAQAELGIHNGAILLLIGALWMVRLFSL